MITFEPEYKAKLWEIQNQHFTKRAVLLPHNEKVFDIDFSGIGRTVLLFG